MELARNSLTWEGVSAIPAGPPGAPSKKNGISFHPFIDALDEFLRQADRHYGMLPGGGPASLCSYYKN
jgi:hypothetical protein